MRTSLESSRRPGVLLALVATAVLALTLVSSAGGGARRTDATVTPITIGGVFCTCHTNMYVAWKKGFFAKRGVPVKSYVLTQGGSLTVAGVLGGQFDFGATTLEAVVRSQALSTPLKAIANVYPEFWALTIRSDQRSTIRKISDLKGKTVGVSTIGSGSWAFLVTMLAKSGINASEVNIVQLGGLSNIVAALRAKRVDASVTWEPGTSAARRGGLGTPIVNLQIPGVSGKVFGSNVSMSQVLAARGDMLAKNPAAATAVIAAIRDADNWLLANKKKPAEVVKILKSVAPGTISTGTLLDAARATLKVQPTSPRLSREGYETSTKALVQSGSLRAQPFENVVDCRFAGCGP